MSLSRLKKRLNLLMKNQKNPSSKKWRSPTKEGKKITNNTSILKRVATNKPPNSMIQTTFVKSK
jgi:hypothetical protein